MSYFSAFFITKIERVIGPGASFVVVSMYASFVYYKRSSMSITNHPSVALFLSMRQSPSLMQPSALYVHGTFLWFDS